MILWPQCSLGTSGTEHLSTASSCHTEHRDNIYTDVMVTQRLWNGNVYADTKTEMVRKQEHTEKRETMRPDLKRLWSFFKRYRETNKWQLCAQTALPQSSAGCSLKKWLLSKHCISSVWSVNTITFGFLLMTFRLRKTAVFIQKPPPKAWLLAVICLMPHGGFV